MSRLRRRGNPHNEEHHALICSELMTVNKYYMVQTLASLGLTEKEICAAFNMTEQQFYQAKRQDPLLQESLDRGRKNPDMLVQKSLFQSGMGYNFIEETVTENIELQVDENGNEIEIITGRKRKVSKKHQPPNSTAIIFWLKNRMPELWRDRTETTITLRDRADLAHQLINRG